MPTTEARLLLFLGGTMYTVSRAHHQPASISRAFVLRKNDGQSYTVTRGDAGDICSCPAFRFGGGGCKHVGALAGIL